MTAQLDLSDLHRLNKIVTDFSSAADRVLFKARQKTLGEAFTADTYDDVLAIFPVFGEIIGSGPRLLDATSTNDTTAGIVRSANIAVGIIPGFGFFLDLAFPASGIIAGLDYIECKEKGGTENECMFPPNTIERDLMEMSQ